MAVQPNSCALLDLPIELRLQIYECIWDAPIHYNLTAMNYQLPNRPDTPKAGLLLSTCKTIYHEASPILYNKTHFKIDLAFVGWSKRSEETKDIALQKWPCLPRIRHLEVRYLYIEKPPTLGQGMERVEALCRVLEQVALGPEAVDVVLRLYSPQVHFGMQKRPVDDTETKNILRLLQADSSKTQLFRRTVAIALSRMEE